MSVGEWLKPPDCKSGPLRFAGSTPARHTNRSKKEDTNRKIESFEQEPYTFLSNFYHSPFIYKGKEYPTVEHAYQASKAFFEKEHEQIRLAATPAQAKKLGRKCVMKDYWDLIKVGMMYQFLFLKFQDPDLEEKLLATENAELIEGNWWGDLFWGVYNGVGENWLGKLLMQIRTQLKQNQGEQSGT